MHGNLPSPLVVIIVGDVLCQKEQTRRSTTWLYISPSTDDEKVGLCYTHTPYFGPERLVIGQLGSSFRLVRDACLVLAVGSAMDIAMMDPTSVTYCCLSPRMVQTSGVVVGMFRSPHTKPRKAGVPQQAQPPPEGGWI